MADALQHELAQRAGLVGGGFRNDAEEGVRQLERLRRWADDSLETQVICTPAAARVKQIVRTEPL